MSKSLNRVTLIGNVGGDPEVRSTQNGNRVANLSLATTHQWKDGKGEKAEKTEWHRLVVWNRKPTDSGLADIIEKYVRKGDKLYVAGRIEYRTWQDKDGATKYTTEIIVDEVILLGGKQQVAAGAGAVPRSVRPQDVPVDEMPLGLRPEDQGVGEDDGLPF